MATASPYADFVAPDTVRYRWDGITVSGTGGKQSLNGGHCSLTFAAYATTWSNLSLSLRGSLDGTNFSILATPTGGAATLTANGILEIEQKPLYVDIATTTGDSSSDVDAVLLQRGW